MDRNGSQRLVALSFPLLVALATGCSVGPNYERPQFPVAGSWNHAYDGIAARPADLTRWWTQFKDPLLDSLVARAVESNLDLRIAQARVRQARALRAIAGSGMWPSLDASGAYSRARTSENAFPQSSQGAANAPLGETRDLFQAGFDASWEIDVFGGVRRRIEAADATLEATIEEGRNTLVTLLGDVAGNYVELRGAQRQLAVARANLEAQRDTLELTRVRFDAGLASDLDVAQAEAQVNTTAAQIPQLESLLKQAAHRLDVLLGSQPGTLAAELFPDAPVPVLPPEVLVGLPSELLRRRPDIRRAERQLAAATAEIGVAVADLFPRFSLTAAFGFQSTDAGDWFSGPSRFWSVGPAVRWPIFNAGRIRANIELRNAEQEQALRQYEKAILTALEDVENALVNYANEQQRHRSLIAAVSANRRAVELAHELYLRGLEDFLNVRDTQRSLYATESELARSEAAMAGNLIALYKALGGGWQAP